MGTEAADRPDTSAVTLPAVLDDAARRSPDREVVFPGDRISWPGLARASRRRARGLAALGVGHGDRVLLLLPSGLDGVTTLVAATRLGAIPVPVNVRGTPGEMAHVARDSGARLVVAAGDLVDRLGDPSPVPVREPGDLDGADEDAGVLPPGPSPDDPMIILYTSGTTARPRGVVHTHRGFTALGAGLVTRLRLTRDDRFWTPLPLHHCGGIDLLMGSLAAACTFVHVGVFTAERALAQLVDERATVAFPAFDTIWLPVLDHPRFDPASLGALRTVINVGPRGRMDAMAHRLPHATQISCLGCTESGGFCCVGSLDDPVEARHGTSGLPLPGMEARVVDPATGRDQPPGTPGEFLFRGVSRLSHYHDDAGTTAERIDDEGWFHSGDLVEADDAGRLRFLSRLKDMLKVGGENVAAAEVEDRLAEHPAVGVVAVVAAPDARLGEVAAAFVQPSAGAVVTEQQLIEHCLGVLATFKVPRYVVFTEQWPMSGTKIQKHELRRRIAAHLAERGITEAPRMTSRVGPREPARSRAPAERPVV